MLPDPSEASLAAVAGRRARAKLKNDLASGVCSPLQVLENSQELQNPESRMRVTEFLRALPGVGPAKTEHTLQQLGISDRKRLGGLGLRQRRALHDWLQQREGKSAVLCTVLAGPTAVGKGTVVRDLLERYPDVTLSVSATTRAARPGEIHGTHYYFVTDEEFDTMLARNELLEWATVHGVHRYGTPRAPIERAVAAGKHVLLEIDVQGAHQVRAVEPSAQLVFLAPPSWDELRRRLTGRGTESAEEQERRLKTARGELAQQDRFDHVIVNETVAEAADKLYRIITRQDSTPRL